jgi:hypothetical protein
MFNELTSDGEVLGAFVTCALIAFALYIPNICYMIRKAKRKLLTNSKAS